MLNLPATRPMATCTVIGRSSSRASAHSCFTTSGSQNPGPRVASAIVRRPSSDEKYCSRTRLTSSGVLSELLYYQSASEVLGKPYANTDRIPDSLNPRIASSEWSGVFWMCDQSSSVVTPALMHSSAPM